MTIKDLSNLLYRKHERIKQLPWRINKRNFKSIHFTKTEEKWKYKSCLKLTLIKWITKGSVRSVTIRWRKQNTCFQMPLPERIAKWWIAEKEKVLKQQQITVNRNESKNDAIHQNRGKKVEWVMALTVSDLLNPPKMLSVNDRETTEACVLLPNDVGWPNNKKIHYLTRW